MATKKVTEEVKETAKKTPAKKAPTKKAEKPAAKPATAKKATPAKKAPAKKIEKPAEKKPAAKKPAAKKPAAKADARKVNIVFESLLGGAITVEAIIKKLPKEAISAYVKIEENTIYWVGKNNEKGSVEIW